MTQTQTDGQTIRPDELPEAVRAYLRTNRPGAKSDAAIGSFTEDAIVVDEGHTYRGHEQIADWMRRAATEYTYTIELIGARRIDADHWVAVHHLEGNFPGGVVDLQFKISMSGGLINRLVIEP